MTEQERYEAMYDEIVDLKNEIKHKEAENEELQRKNSELEIELKAMRGADNSYKAEIERLKKDSKRLKKLQMQLDDLCKMHHIIKAEAYKEFAERLKESKYESSDWSHGEHPFVVEESDIDNLLYELEGDNDA